RRSPAPQTGGDWLRFLCAHLLRNHGAALRSAGAVRFQGRLAPVADVPGSVSRGSRPAGFARASGPRPVGTICPRFVVGYSASASRCDYGDWTAVWPHTTRNRRQSGGSWYGVGVVVSVDRISLAQNVCAAVGESVCLGNASGMISSTVSWTAWPS